MINQILKLIGAGQFTHPKVRAYYLSFQEIEAVMGSRKLKSSNEIRTEDRLSLSSGLFDRTVLGLP
jgi:hypothetical protein